MTMPEALLTIVVPTYNRAGNLELLLRTLHAEVASDASVRVLVSDNASTDRTAAVIATMCETWPALAVQRHECNIGPDGNFCSCVERIDTRYFWIIGDDDLPKRGVAAKLLALLRDTAPALVYMRSEWLSPLTGPDQGEPVGALNVETLNAIAFARRVNVWLTFISGVVIDRRQLMLTIGDHSIRRFTATNLVQLGWILPLLKADTRFAYVHNRCVLATKDNTGGYALFQVFGINFASICASSFGPRAVLTKILVRRNVACYLPALIWNLRFARVGRFDDSHQQLAALRPHLRRHLSYWALVLPVSVLPRRLAYPFFAASLVAGRVTRFIDGLRARRTSASGHQGRP